jgi:hypothetical protein
VFVVEIELPGSGLGEEFTTAVAEELVQADLHLERGVAVLGVDLQVGVGDERDLLVGSLSGQDVSE